jgi:hypothetical protein
MNYTTLLQRYNTKTRGSTKCQRYLFSNSHYETDFGDSIAKGDGITKIGFLKARRWRAFKNPICIISVLFWR